MFGASGSVVAAIAVGGPWFHLDRVAAEKFGSLVAASAHALSSRLGYDGTPVGQASAGTSDGTA